MADLVVDDLTKQYPTPGKPLVILQGVSLSLSCGENLGIIGPSGSGKSTLLQIVGTLDTPTTGTVKISGQDPFSLSEPKLAAFRSEKIGFVFQDHFLLPQLTAIENVLVPALGQGAVAAEIAERGRQLLDRVGLADRMQHRPGELSGGERQRVAIARALIHRPLLVMADEPTGNLDPTTAQAITELLLEIQRDTEQQTMMIVVTHSVELAERLQRCVRIDNGRLSSVENAA